MKWFNDKPKEEHVYFTKLPIEDNKLNSYIGDTTGKKKHPVVVIKNNDDGTSDVIGCTSKYKEKLKDIELNTTPEMDKNTYARVHDGERRISTKDLDSKGKDIRCNNAKDLREHNG